MPLPLKGVTPDTGAVKCAPFRVMNHAQIMKNAPASREGCEPHFEAFHRKQNGKSNGLAPCDFWCRGAKLICGFTFSFCSCFGVVLKYRGTFRKSSRGENPGDISGAVIGNLWKNFPAPPANGGIFLKKTKKTMSGQSGIAPRLPASLSVSL